ncbi:MAG: PhnD/SsuA/transferrin family substrate-binding protein [Acidiferrobacterales bacterium]
MRYAKSLFLCCALLVAAQVAAKDTEIRIGVLAFRGEKTAQSMWSPTARYLSKAVPGYRFSILPLNLAEMQSAVGLARVDFVITNTGNYVDLESRYGISRILTLKNRRQGNPYTEFGAVIFTRSDRENIKSLSDLKGRSFMAVSRDAFGGFQMAWRELTDHDIDPFRDFKELRFSGFPQDKIVHAVRSGEVDAGTIRTDTLERMAIEGKIELADFRILNPRKKSGFPFWHSTRLYPEWPFAKLKHTPDKLAQRVAVALLTLPADSAAALAARSAGWTIPLDYAPVHELFRQLKVRPHENMGKLTPGQLWDEYGHWFVIAIAALLVMMGVTAYVLRINRRIAISEQVLRKEVQDRKLAEEKLAAHRDTLEQRVATRTQELNSLNRALQEDIVARMLAEETLRKSESALRTLHDITSSRSLSFANKVEALLRTGCEHFALSFGALTRIEDDTCFIQWAHAPNGEIARGDQLPLSDTFCAVVSSSLEPLSIPDAADSKFNTHPCFSEHGKRAYFGSPVLVNGFVFGSLSFSDTRPRDESFTKVDTDVLLLMAQWIGGELERTTAEARARQHQAELAHVARLSTMGEMASGIAHELNQPLTAIVNYTRGCVRRMQRNRGDTEIQEIIAKVTTEAERAGQIILRVREFVRKGKLQHDIVDLRDVVRTVTEMAMSQIRHEDIDIQIVTDTDLSPVFADKIQLEQVVLNLVRNAIDATRERADANRKLSIRIGRKGDASVSVRVTDTGQGIPRDKLTEIFDPFFTTKEDGMGMGLSISRSIIEAHDGRIFVESIPEQGTTVEFVLPVHDPALHEKKSVA